MPKTGKRRRYTPRGAGWMIEVSIDYVELQAVLEFRDRLGALFDAGEGNPIRLYISGFVDGIGWVLEGRQEFADHQVRISGDSPQEFTSMLQEYFDRLPGDIFVSRLQERTPTRFSASGRPCGDVPWQETPSNGNLREQVLTEIYGVVREARSNLGALEQRGSGPLGAVNGLDALMRKTDLKHARKRRTRFEKIAEHSRREAFRSRSATEQRISHPTETRGNGHPSGRASARRSEAPAPPKPNGATVGAATAPAPQPPPVSLAVEFPDQSCLNGAQASADASLDDFLRIETAALWWISNQSDDLLCLPYCSLDRLDYQLRTALRVIGPLRGRALLSDEVGLGKTIEAGLVLKEYLTRGMVNRFLILTVPSLVDQWSEELESKFNLKTATTNQAAFRSDPGRFWREEPAIIASLHTFKSEKHQRAASSALWDIVIVDEAHYLRRSSSLAWKAVNATQRKFLLLLTATPVQNSLEDLYHLVTLLQPGQLPAPQEFRRRFIDKNRPHQPREPAELRRLLGQVMIRNTRANSGIVLPPRRAETVEFDPAPAEAEFLRDWERDLRDQLDRLNPGQARLWGRLLLQALGSSPGAWEASLRNFPARDAAARWLDGAAPLRSSWERKSGLLLPLARSAPHLVVFTQFVATQEQLAAKLREANASVWVINGQTPAAERHGITERFRRDGGALLLTQSGTEGRNLQFCHRLVNFDLPWNPMEIEQRIGRLHRIGQESPVEIYNFVQTGTLQAHLLGILQDKLNLFELVVGETSLILGDRFSSDDFAEEVFARWRSAGDDLSAAFETLGRDLETAREHYGQVKQLDETLFSDEYETV